MKSRIASGVQCARGIILALSILSSLSANADLKEVQFDWNTNTVLWDGRANFIPALEAFKIKVTNYPANASMVIIYVYESGGNNSNDVYRTSPRIPYAALKSGNDFVVTISALRFHRFYYLEVEVVSVETQVSVPGAAQPRVTNGTIELVNRNASGTTIASTEGYVTRQVITTVTPATGAAPAAGAASEKRETITHESRILVLPVYTVPYRSEISKLEFLGGFGSALFSQKGSNETDGSIAFVTGLKIKWRPVSTNTSITRFGLYPFKSRISLVVGAVINELKYKTSTLQASFAGLKPIVGLDYELSESLGITAGAIIVNQPVSATLTDDTDTVVGVYLGLSFSFNAFEKFRANVPAIQGLPTTLNNNPVP